MSYLSLNKRQRTGKTIQQKIITESEFVKLIEIEKPYKDGTKWAIYETTSSPFCSNRLFSSLTEAKNKFFEMVNGYKQN